MGNSPAAVTAAVEELRRLYQELPRRPSTEEVDAATEVLTSAETEDATRLGQVEAAAPPEDGVPGELLDVLREARVNAVPPISSLRRRKEATLVMEVERRFQVFDDLLMRASRVVAGEGMVGAAPAPTALAESVETVRRTPRSDISGLDDEMVLWDILLRLPARSVLCCRAVCRSWRRLTSDPAFLLAHHRRQPTLPLIYLCRGSSDCVDAIDLQAAQLRPVVRSTWSSGYSVIASCDGLLLLSSTGCFYICNPVTNQWAALPLLLRDNFLGFYRHSLSGEYRLLCAELQGEESVCKILTLGSDEPRRITMTMGSDPVEEPMARKFMMDAYGNQSALVNGNLHWYLRDRNDGNKIMVFDTGSESFHWMHHPIIPGWGSLSGMDNTLVITTSEDISRIDLWVLQDYQRSIWACKHRVDLLMTPIRQFPECSVVNGGWFAIFVSVEGDFLVRCSNRFFHCDKKGNLLATFQCDARLPMHCFHRLKESLVLHSFFQMQHDNVVGLPDMRNMGCVNVDHIWSDLLQRPTWCLNWQQQRTWYIQNKDRRCVIC